MALVLLGELVLVGEHAVPAINIPPGKGFWRLMKKPFTHLWSVSTRGVKPGFGQAVDRVVDPGWTRDPVTPTEPFYRSGTESRPPEGVGTRSLWKNERISDELCTLIFSIVKPFIHEIAQGYPRFLTLTDDLIGQSHALYAITCLHSVSQLYLLFLTPLYCITPLLGK
jgi:hypothetical protein